MKSKSLLAILLAVFALILVIIGSVYDLIQFMITRAYCDFFSVELNPETENINVEPNNGRLIKVSVQNTGYEDEYETSVKGPDWVKMRPDKIRLKPDSTEDLFVYLGPSEKTQGVFDVEVSVDSYCVHEEKTIKVQV